MATQTAKIVQSSGITLHFRQTRVPQTGSAGRIVKKSRLAAGRIDTAYNYLSLGAH